MAATQFISQNGQSSPVMKLLIIYAPVLATREQNKLQSQSFITYFCTLLSNMTRPYIIQQKGEAKPEYKMFNSQHAISPGRKPPEKVHWRWWQLVTELGMPHGIQSSQDDQ